MLEQLQEVLTLILTAAAPVLVAVAVAYVRRLAQRAGVQLDQAELALVREVAAMAVQAVEAKAQKAKLNGGALSSERKLELANVIAAKLATRLRKLSPAVSSDFGAIVEAAVTAYAPPAPPSSPALPGDGGAPPA